MSFNTVFSTLGVLIAYMGMMFSQGVESVVLIMIGCTLFIVFSVAPFLGYSDVHTRNNQREMK